MVNKRSKHVRSNIEELQLRKLMSSVTQNDLTLVKKILDYGSPYLVNMLDTVTKETPIHAAVCNNLHEMTKLLIESGGNILKKDKQGRTPLVRAADKGNKIILNLLVHYGGSVNDRDSNNQHVLFYCLKPTARHLECLEILLKEGADINTVDDMGETVLAHAVRNGFVEITQTLIALGADVHVNNKYKEGLIHIAAQNNKAQIIPLLAKGGAPINHQDADGNTCVHRCVKDNKLELLELLSKEGAELTLPNNNGDTPIHIGVKEGELEVIKFLLNKGVPLEVVNGDNLTPRTIASTNKDTFLKKLLKKHENKMKKAVLEGRISKTSEYWKIILYNWTKEFKNFLIDDFFGKDTNQTGMVEIKVMIDIMEKYQAPLSLNQKEEILNLHATESGLIKYLDFLDGNLYLRTAAYDGFARV